MKTKKLFFSSAYNVKHSLITPENAAEMLKDDIRARLVGNVNHFLHPSRTPVVFNSGLEYIGGFYYEEDIPGCTVCQTVVRRELQQIREADVIMVSLLKYSAIASVTELVYASQFADKKIYVFCDPSVTQFEVPYEYWFPVLTAMSSSLNTEVIFVKSEDDIVEFIKNMKTA